MKKIWIAFVAALALCLSCITITSFAQNTKKTVYFAPVTVPVKVTVSNANWTETISICNTTSAAIPLTNLEFTFNYSPPMPSNIWGNPWAAWQKVSQTGTTVILKGGTPYTPPLQPDPNCTNPLTIQFTASPDLPQPFGPFVFKAEGAQPPPGSATLNIIMQSAPAANLPTPTVSVTGPNTSKQQTLAWGATWQIKDLSAGSYTISSSPVDNGTSFFAAPTITADLQSTQIVTKNITYTAVSTARVTVTLTDSPSTTVPVTFTGTKYTITKTVSNGTAVVLPADTYNVTSDITGYSSTITPNPITVPTNNAITIKYTKNQGGPTSGPYSTGNGNILDKNKMPVTFQGVNWFGFNTGNHMLHGLWQSDFTVMLNQIKSLGFNAVRIPFAFDFVLDTAIKPSGITNTCNGKPCNGDIPQDSAFNAFQYIVKRFTDNGFYVLLDDHYEDNTYVNSYAQWLAGWQKIANTFKSNPSVGYDLWNEPDSHNLTWETNAGGTAWSKGLMDAATAIYAIDTSKLIFIEGVAQGALEANWGDGFATDNAAVNQGVSNPKNFFTQLATKPFVNQIVVSPHMYGPDGTNNQGPDHSDPTKAFAVWSRLHGYLFNNFLNVNGTSQSGFCVSGSCHLYPIAVGEFGGKFDTSDPYYEKDTATQINIANYLVRLGSGKPAMPSWFYWDWNPNSGNTGGILKDDWATIDCNKVNYLKKYLALKPATGICGS